VNVRRLVSSLLVFALIGGALFIVPTLWFQPWTPDLLYTRVFAAYLMRHPMVLAEMGVLNRVPFGSWRDRLDDFSERAEVDEARQAKESLDRLMRYDRRRMTSEQRLSADVMEWYLRDQVEGEKWRHHGYPVNQMYGFQQILPNFMLNTQPLHDARDARSYVRRVAAFPLAFDQTIERVKIREAAGVMPPRFVLREVRDEMLRFIDRPARQNDLYTHFAAGLDSLRDVSANERRRLLGDLERTLTDTVTPAYHRMIAVIAHQESLATDDDGVWKLPDGDAYYDYMLRHHTTSNLPADSIHALGLREVERLQTQMRGLMSRLPVHAGTFAEQLRQIRHDPAFGFPPGDEGRRQILARYQEILADASRRCDSLFDVRPRGTLRVERTPVFMEATVGGAYYNTGAIDGSRPGVFYTNLKDPTATRRPDMRTLAYHEGIPGHHFQGTIAIEMKGLPFFRRVLPFTAYLEGWGLYAERLALEHGFHQDAYDSLGAMGAELFRAVRLVVDTGIHRKRWTRDQAIDYVMTHTGMDSAATISQVERYIVFPGQACAYKVGQLEILALRQRAMDRLGSRFDIRRFHDAVLTHGALPLALLDRVVDQWIESELRASDARVKG
jgi:uncharacterized protein (DUF885 family)